MFIKKSYLKYKFLYYLYGVEKKVIIKLKTINIMPTTHHLKISPKYYRDIESNGKRFEVRFNDRDFKVGDTLNLWEWAGGEYTGRKIICEVKYILDNPDYCKEGYVIMQIKVIQINN